MDEDTKELLQREGPEMISRTANEHMQFGHIDLVCSFLPFECQHEEPTSSSYKASTTALSLPQRLVEAAATVLKSAVLDVFRSLACLQVDEYFEYSYPPRRHGSEQMIWKAISRKVHGVSKGHNRRRRLALLEL